jgi:ATP-dependent RNA helicase SUPV3L1/SUV3
VASLASSDRKRLSLLGVRFGVESIYLEPLLKPEAIRLRGLLWALKSGGKAPPIQKGFAAPRDPAISAAAYEAMGYRVLGNRALRLDRVERLAARVRALARQGAFAASPELASLAGCAAADLPGVLAALGYRSFNPGGQGIIFRARAPSRRSGAKPGPRDGPFAKLKELTLAR